MKKKLKAKLDSLVKKTAGLPDEKVEGLTQMISSCQEYIADKALSHPISFLSYRERQIEFLDYCKGYLEQRNRWAAILRSLNFSQIKTVCELAPGYATKALWGLIGSEFNGHVTCIDRDREILNKAHALNAFINYPFEIDYRCHSIYQSIDQKFDLVCGNHLIDDLLIDHCKLDNVYTFHSDEEFLEQYSKAIKSLEADQIDQFCTRLCNAMVNLLSDNGTIVLVEYSNLFVEANTVTDGEAIYLQCIDHIKSSVKGMGFEELDLITPSDCNVVILTKPCYTQDDSNFGRTG